MTTAGDTEERELRRRPSTYDGADDVTQEFEG